jgi:tRNA(Ile)-lysidine synthase
MPPALDPVHRELARFLRAHGVGRTTRLLAAVSGGSDSVALLHALLALGQRVAVAHVHHGLRGAEAERELEFVAQLSTQLGVAFHVERVDAARRDGRSPEARARALRYAALERMRVAGGYARLLTAHQRDDQAETVLLRALRGTGPAGLSAVRPSLDAGRVLRPLLGLRRAELAEYLARRGLAFVSDSSNADRAIPRNRLRAEVVPILEAIAPGAVASLAQLAELAREAEDAARPPLDALLDRGLEPGEGGLWLEVAALASLEAPLRRRALARLVVRAGLGEHASRGGLERIDAFLRNSRAGQRLSLAGRHALYRDRARVWLGPETGPAFPSPVLRSFCPGESLEFPERRIRLSWHDSPSSRSVPDPLCLPVRDLVERYTVRSACDADRVHTRGRERRLKDVLAAARWSKLERARALVVERGGEILWIPGLIPMTPRGAREKRGSEIRAERLSSPPYTC